VSLHFLVDLVYGSLYLVLMEDTKVIKKEPDTTYMRLIKDFPDDAMTLDNSRGFPLTSVKAQCVVERLNQVFGYDGWEQVGKFDQGQNGILYFGELRVGLINCSTEGKSWNASHSGIGYAVFKANEGDSYKSAKTDCLSKCASWFGIGNEVYKGNVTPPKKQTQKQQHPANQNNAQPKAQQDGDEWL